MKGNNNSDVVIDKKLKQARLSFQRVSPRSSQSETSNKKRKLSSCEDYQNVKKSANVKEDLTNDEGHIITLDSENDDAAILSDNPINIIHTKLLTDTKNIELVHDTKLSTSDIKLGDSGIDILLSEPIEATSDVIKIHNQELPNKVIINKESASQDLQILDNIHKLVNTNCEVVSDNDSIVNSDLGNQSLSNIASPIVQKNNAAPDDLNVTADSDHFVTPRLRKRKSVNDVTTPGSSEENPKEILTPKQIRRKLELAKKRDEKEQERIERERKRQDEKEERQKQRQEKEEQKKKEREEKEDLKRKEREEKEELRKKEREEKEIKRKAEVNQKNEEKRKKDEVKEEERRKREQEKEDAELKKKKVAAAFVNFFVPKKSEATSDEEKENKMVKLVIENNQNFMPFSVKIDMKLAPTIRRILSIERKEILDCVLNKTKSPNDLYLSCLKKGSIVVGKSLKTWPLSELKDDVTIVEEEGEAIVESRQPREQFKAKLMLFHENRRPPYWGTWSKTSSTVYARKPFGKDKILDYDVDSDSDWEEEEPGESLHGSDDEKDKDESEDDYEVDNDFFVPHGYLSDEEINEEEEIKDNSPGAHKAKLKILQTEFNAEMKKKTEKIKPRLIGCIWTNEDSSIPAGCTDAVWALLLSNKMIYDSPIVLSTDERCLSPSTNDTLNPLGSKLKKFPECYLPDLIRLVHGNSKSKNFLSKEFVAFMSKQNTVISRICILRKILEIAQYKPRHHEQHDKTKCWLVAEDVLKKYQFYDLPIINNWAYILKPKRQRLEVDVHNPADKEQLGKCKPPVVKEKCNLSIRKFTKVLSEEEKKNRFISKDYESKTGSPHIVGASTSADTKKRLPLLASAPLGTPIVKSRNNLLSKFLSSATISEMDSTTVDKSTIALDENIDKSNIRNFAVIKETLDTSDNRDAKGSAVKNNLLKNFLAQSKTKPKPVKAMETDESNDCVILSD